MGRWGQGCVEYEDCTPPEKDEATLTHKQV